MIKKIFLLITYSIFTVITPKIVSLPPPSLKIFHIVTQKTPQLGIDLLWYVKNPKETITQITKQAYYDMNYIVSLHANSVDINIPFFTKSSTSSLVYSNSATPTPKELAIAIKIAKQHNLRVTIRPLLDETDLGAGNWRGNIKPSNISEWFISYEKFLQPYLVTAEKYKIPTFILGVELSSLQSLGQWNKLILKVQKIFHGQLGYSENWDMFHTGKITPNLKRIGVDAYFPIKVTPNVSINNLTKGWEDWFNTIPVNINKSLLVIDEVGIASQNGAYLQPSYTGNDQPLNFLIQSNWFTAACTTVKNLHLGGIYYWDFFFNNSHQVNSFPTSFVGRPGAQAIKSCFESFR